jgi:hypothetical protein
MVVTTINAINGLGNHGLASMAIHIHFKLEHGFGGAYEGSVM